MVKTIAVTITVLCSVITASAQIGGRGAYSFLNLQASPRLASLGGAPVAIPDADPNIGFYLPSQLSEKMDRHLAMNYMNYFSDINIGMVNYVKHRETYGTFSAGMLYANYGKFKAMDEGGNDEGSFYASDYAFQVGYGARRGNWSYGANLKLVYSQLEKYVSVGNALDFSGSYTSDSGLFSSSLLLRNIGVQWKTYAGQREQLPFEVQWSFSTKLRHAPVRLIAVLHNLQTWEVGYINTNDRTRNLSFEEDEKEEKVGFADHAFRHVILATELVFTPNFMVRLGYNHQRRMEMTWEEGKRFTGFSWGAGVKISRLRFDYALASFFPGKPSHQFALTLNLNEFKKKKK